MKKKTEIKEDSKSFERFETLLRQVVSVPKKEIDEREKIEKQRKKRKRKTEFQPFFFFLPRLVTTAC